MSQASPGGGVGPRSHSAELGLAIAVVVVACLTALLDANHNYWRSPGLAAQEIVRQTVILGIFALGSAIVIIIGGIDLSIGSMIAFGGATFASVLLLVNPEAIKASGHLPPGDLALAAAATLAAGFLVGSLHAWLITAVGLPPFVATLATLVGLRSLGRAMVEGVNRLMLESSSTQINVNDRDFRGWINSIPLRAGIFICLAIVLWTLMSGAVTGRRLYALGGNETAARLSGIRTERLKWLAYCLSAMCASIAGILYVGDQSVADPQSLGQGYELNAIAAAVVGGCSLQGGVGTIPGVVLGCLFLRVVIDGIAKIIKTDASLYEGLIVGIVVAVAVAFSQSGRDRQFFAGALGAVAVVTLSLFAGLLLALFVGKTVAIAGGLAALAMLSGVKFWEHRRTSG